jgi:hypothetical protein
VNGGARGAWAAWRISFDIDIDIETGITIGTFPASAVRPPRFVLPRS